jgi:hypothetical protein
MGRDPGSLEEPDACGTARDDAPSAKVFSGMQDMNPTSSRPGGDPLGWREELRHALGQPALASFSDDAQTEDSEACRSAYQVAACLGKCRLFGVDAGELDGLFLREGVFRGSGG